MVAPEDRLKFPEREYVDMDTWTAGMGGTWTDAGFTVTELDDDSPEGGTLGMYRVRYFPDRKADTIMDVYAKELAAKRS